MNSSKLTVQNLTSSFSITTTQTNKIDAANSLLYWKWACMNKTKYRVVLSVLSTLMTFCLVFSVNNSQAYAESAYSEVKLSVMEMSCRDELTIEQALQRAIKSHSQRDLGWRVYLLDDGQFDVVRSVLRSKVMKTRYRWRVSFDGVVLPQNKKAQKLCQSA
jgi:uncharacterized protein YpmS